jgi:hypothetical protein
MTEEHKNQELPPGASFKELAKHMGNTPIAPAHGIAAIALDMAMKYHDMSIIKDGAMYQQYKLEGRNIRGINLDTVFETAIRIEAWLLGASERIAKIVVDAISTPVDDEPSGQAGDAPDGSA